MQVTMVKTRKDYQCVKCDKLIHKGDPSFVRTGSVLKNEKRRYFKSRYHSSCLGQLFLDEYDKGRTNESNAKGRPPFLDVLTMEQRKLRNRTASYLNGHDKKNLIRYYEEENPSRVLDTWFLIAERIEILLTFEVPFNLPWKDNELAIKMVRNEPQLIMKLTNVKLEEFPEIIWEYVRTSRRAIREQ
ncbi:hypothetical protein LCGC14_0740480 [marine sediment metagenome]|uniref:PARP-type domain-containing protein n=1 Tax=marine sediment metagenome TaxID=412755 RepID=A0A0F9QB48_9ZZZZ